VIAVILAVFHTYYFFRAIMWMFLWLSSYAMGKVTVRLHTPNKRYYLLCPMYKESQMVEQLVNNLNKIQYPRDLLHVCLLLEPDDLNTIEAAKQITGRFDDLKVHVMIVPEYYPGPKTKPRAMNYALEQIKDNDGYVVVYDAEDEPEIDQLLKAVTCFDRNPQIHCYQAALNYKNFKENWLSRMFTMEYSFWFDNLILGLATIEAPIPLGGTSNHFRIQSLRDVGGWDSFNVTEDCELGLRMYKNNMKVGVLNSTTWEEACCQPWNWIKQRTRWSMGYMYTWATVSSPKNWRGLLTWHLFVLGTPLVALINVFMLSVFGLWVTGHDVSTFFPTLFYYKLGILSFVVGNGTCILLPAIAFWARGHKKRALLCLTLPIYWLLHSIAAYRALYQYIKNPHKWEKTQHGLSKRDDREKQ